MEENRTKKIMIVDDEKTSLLITDHILKTVYNTVCASSGAEAIALYGKEKPDMVLSDLRMPGMSGFELQSELQKMSSAQIPFMFMTADKDDETESRGFAQGAQDFIRKPFRVDVLLRRVGNILQNVDKIQQFKKAAQTDPMTGLLNKASSQEEIGALCKSAQGALLMIDLDSFKLVNDIYGHAMGDRILIRFAEIIRAVVRSSDLVGRLGGDEFIAFCQNVNSADVIEKKSLYINENIVSSAKEFMGDDMTIPLGASIGCVFAPFEGTDFQTLYKKADKALYSVKQNGKHGYSIYKDEEELPSKDSKDATDLTNTIKILSERNISQGALSLSFEQFQLVFRFLKRMTVNYARPVWIVLFSITKSGGEANSQISFQDAAEIFFDTLRTSLRQSDVVTMKNKNQCLVLLLEVLPENLNIVTNRIMHKWNETEASLDYEITYEIESMKQ